MNCPLETRENAQVLLDYCTRRLDAAPLDATPAAALERHIAICPACREFAYHQRAVWQAMDAWEVAPVTKDFDERLYRRIETQVSWWDTLVRPFRPLRHMTAWRAAQGMALAGLLLAAGILLERPGASPGPPATGAGDVAQADTVQPEQVEQALDAMEMLSEFSRRVRTDIPDSKL